MNDDGAEETKPKTEAVEVDGRFGKNKYRFYVKFPAAVRKRVRKGTCVELGDIVVDV